MPRLRRSNYLSVTACMHPFPPEPHVKFGSRLSCANYHIKTEPAATTSIFATGQDKREHSLALYSPVSDIHHLRNLYLFQEEPVLSNSIGTCTEYERAEYWANTSLGSSVYCTYGSVLSLEPRVRLRCLKLDTVGNYHSQLRYSA